MLVSSTMSTLSSPYAPFCPLWIYTLLVNYTSSEPPFFQEARKLFPKSAKIVDLQRNLRDSRYSGLSRKRRIDSLPSMQESSYSIVPHRSSPRHKQSSAFLRMIIVSPELS